MKKALLLLGCLFSVPVVADCDLFLESNNEKEFHYNDCVVVKSGFYQGCKGRVKNYRFKYVEVELECKGDIMGLTDIEQEKVEIVKNACHSK